MWPRSPPDRSTGLNRAHRHHACKSRPLPPHSQKHASSFFFSFVPANGSCWQNGSHGLPSMLRRTWPPQGTLPKKQVAELDVKVSDPGCPSCALPVLAGWLPRGLQTLPVRQPPVTIETARLCGLLLDSSQRILESLNVLYLQVLKLFAINC